MKKLNSNAIYYIAVIAVFCLLPLSGNPGAKGLQQLTKSAKIKTHFKELMQVCGFTIGSTVSVVSLVVICETIRAEYTYRKLYKKYHDGHCTIREKQAFWQAEYNALWTRFKKTGSLFESREEEEKRKEGQVRNLNRRLLKERGDEGKKLVQIDGVWRVQYEAERQALLEAPLKKTV